ncbi:MAG: hypothetical protein ICV55_03275 [Coleofasciculus sp. C3-bin4]|nr:hypothetical protein [Coleofasciculus sp. C3-bin4]
MPISAKTLKRIRDRFKRFMRKEKAVSRDRVHRRGWDIVPVQPVGWIVTAAVILAFS